MPATDKIEMRLSAPGGRDRGAPLEDFAKACNALQLCLAGVARCLGRDHIEVPITNLAYSSAVIEVATDSETAATFDDTIAAFEQGRLPDERLDYQALKQFKRFSPTAEKPGLVIELQSLTLTSRYVENVRATLEHSLPESGSVSGRLEAFNVHTNPTFTLYPPVPNEKIECHFKRSQQGLVLKAVAKHVTVFGSLRYRRGKAFPSRVNVDHFVINPEDRDLPTLLEPPKPSRSTKPEPGTTAWDGADEWD